MNLEKFEIAKDFLYLPKYNILVNKEIENVFKKNFDQKEITVNKIKITKEILKQKTKNISELTLEITQACNLKCKYCIYSGNYVGFRKSSSKEMDFSTAKTGIDYIFNHIKDRKKKEFIIGFYGGCAYTSVLRLFYTKGLRLFNNFLNLKPYK